MRNTVHLVLKGICIGTANVVPGLSGGTIAVLLRVYYPLIHSIAACSTVKLRAIFRALQTLIPLFFGVFLGLLGAARLLSQFIETHAGAIGYAFAGLIVGSIPAVYISLFSDQREEKPPYKKPSTIILFTVSFALCILLPLLSIRSPLAQLSQQYPRLILFLAAIPASAAMILPGISGALILLLLGVYPKFIAALSTVNFVELAIIAGGACIGILGFAKIISILYKRHRQYINACIFGLVAASPLSLLQNTENGVSFPLVLLLVAASLVSYFLGIASNKKA